MLQKKKEIGFKIKGIQTYQILTNDDEVCMCIPSLSRILLAVCTLLARYVEKVPDF